MIEFAIRSTDYNRYKDFKHEVERMGWRYFPNMLDKFTPSAMVNNDCLFFSNKFDDFNRALYAFSQTDNSCMIFNIDNQTGYEQGVIFAQKQIDKILNR